jgi:tRNA threonylcarbamoyladenosine biosynthesis protein TsaE
MISGSVLETQIAARCFVDRLTAGSRAFVVALQGDLGSGKTAFAQGVAAALGIKDTVQSPTFVIEKLYKTSHPKFKKLVHIDAYRLDSADELLKLGWKETVADPGNLVLVEWPERVAEIMPDDAEIIRFEFIDENTRNIKFEHGEEE